MEQRANIKFCFKLGKTAAETVELMRQVYIVTNRPGYSTRLLPGQTMYASCKCNIWARSPNHCCRGKAICITYSEYVFAASGILNAKCVFSAPCYNVICGLSYRALFSRKKKLLCTKTSFDFLYNVSLCNVSHSKKNSDGYYHKSKYVFT